MPSDEDEDDDLDLPPQTPPLLFSRPRHSPAVSIPSYPMRGWAGMPNGCRTLTRTAGERRGCKTLRPHLALSCCAPSLALPCNRCSPSAISTMVAMAAHPSPTPAGMAPSACLPSSLEGRSGLLWSRNLGDGETEGRGQTAEGQNQWSNIRPSVAHPPCGVSLSNSPRCKSTVGASCAAAETESEDLYRLALDRTLCLPRTKEARKREGSCS